MKLQRKYQLTIQYDDLGSTVVINDPITLELDIHRAIFSSVNTATFRIYNLSPTNRLKLIHDWGDFSHYRSITLNAGYEDQTPLPLIFKGNVIQSYSRRERTNFVTEIECYSGIYAVKNTTVQTSGQAGVSTSQTILQMIQAMSKNHVSLGAVSTFTNPASSRGDVSSGSAWDKIQSLVPDNAQVYIDNEKVYVLNENDYIQSADGLDFLINASTGLLETPRRQRLRLDVSTLFEPRINIGNVVKLQSLEEVYNGRYPVIGVNHSGIISGAFSGKLTTTINLNKGTGLLNPVKGR